MRAVRVYKIIVQGVITVFTTTRKREAEREARKYANCDGFRMEIFTVYKQ